jgi:2-polyprenyl-3-methyl-5-hydroxy-6-metoxy-1,4-benzoquinol methylase
MRILKSVVHRAGRWYIRRICSSEFQCQAFTVHNERTIEYRFALQVLGENHPKNILDVGTGTTAWPHLLSNCGYVVTAVDNIRDYWPEGMVNRHWAVLDVDILAPKDKLSSNFEAITCISVLEHIADHARAIKNMVSLLATRGVLILTTPYSHHHPYANVYRHPEALYGKDATYICRSSSETELNQWLAAGLTLERRELWRLFTGPVWATGQRCTWQAAKAEEEPHQLGCFVFRKQ